MMISDFMFEANESWTHCDEMLFESYDGVYSSEHETYKIGISDTCETALHIEEIQDFLADMADNYSTLIERTINRRIVITATVPHGDFLSRRIMVSHRMIELLWANRIEVDYEVGASYEEEDDEEDEDEEEEVADGPG